METYTRKGLITALMMGSVLYGVNFLHPLDAMGSCASPANQIETENCLPGTPASTWDISGAGDPSIQGFATDISVNVGEMVRFKIDTNATSYTLDIYRMGYYGGMGARKVATVLPSAPLPQNQPNCLTEASTGLIDCGNWAESASWTVPANATSGIYFALATRTDTGGASHIFFIVRNDAGQSDILFQTSDTTWQAYNRYGGNSLYVGSPDGRAYKVSYNRPFTTRGCCAEDWVFNAEYPMVRWLEANGYNVSYFTGIDTDRRGSQILNHRVFLSVGHDEYWSAAQRANVEAARNAGVHLAFFSGNEVFWKTRWENSIDGSITPYRTLVSYKETHANAKIDPLPDVWTGTWRDPRFSPPADGGRPENALTGTIFMVNDGATTSITVPEPEGKRRLWRNTSVASLQPGQTATLPDGTLGYEWDEDLDNGFRPSGLIRMSSTTVSVPSRLLDFGSNYGSGTANHALTLYRHASGALVFGAGTVQWSWGLDDNHDRAGAAPDVRMQQATVNLFADTGAQPVTLQPGLLPATASTDTTAPTSSITSPAPGSSVEMGSPVTITGTAADTGTGTVGGVEVSVDGGTSWHRAVGFESWNYTWTPGALGTVMLRSRAVDDSGNLETPSAGVSVTVTAACPNCTIWPSTAVPGLVDGGPDSSVELGVKFRADSNGFIKGIRFYKASTNAGTHVANLWTSSGTRLATTTFTGETASGWQQVLFSSPVAITANTLYVASYHANTGHYSADVNYFATGVDNPPLHALANGVSGGNGVYAYGATSNFPTLTWNSANYWVDVVFSATPPPTLLSIAVTPSTPTILTGTTQQFTATGTYSDGSTQNLTSQTTWASSNTSVATITSTGLATAVNPGSTTISATLSGITGSTTLTVQAGPLSITTTSLPGGTQNVAYAATLAASGGTTPYTWAIASGSLPTGLSLNSGTGAISGTPTATGTFSFTAQVTDSSNPGQTTTKALSIVVSVAADFTIWPGTAVPGLVDGGPDSAVELGVKFRADSNGFITGIRFYKASTNTGTHVGNLWTSSGTRLATTTFTGETASGWQQVLFSSPVAIAANTVYVASYHANTGHYSADVNYFATGVDNPPLHALANGVSGGNGVYAYGATSNFPTLTWNSANYWVDVVFSATPPATLSSIAVTPSTPTILTGTTQQFTATGTYSDGSTQNLTSQTTWASSNTSVATITSTGLATAVNPGSTTISATVGSVVGSTTLSVQPAPLAITTTSLPGGLLNVSYSATLTASGGTTPYTWAIASGSLPTGLLLNSGTGGISGTPTATGTFSFTVQVTDSSNPGQTTTKALSIVIDLSPPILIISSASNPFSGYYAEILRAEGFNEFAMSDISLVSSTVLASYDVVILGDMVLTSDQVTMLSNWVSAGGHLIAMRPDKKLAGLLGLTDLSSTISNAYLLVNTSSGPGVGIVNQTIQYHGTADLYSLSGAINLATLYSNATTATSSPAVTLESVGTMGGQAAAFTYDLARSVVYTRQGNPAWAGQERDGFPVIRPDDLFYGAASFDPQPNWVDLNKVAIPQADEQQRLLANLIIEMNFNKRPLPRFWYFPRGLTAVVIMAGDDHANGGTAGRFDSYISMSPPGCSVDNWECIRSTSYIYTNTPLSNAQASAYNNAGFEVGLHVTTGCDDYTPTSLESFFSSQLDEWTAKYSSLPSPVTNRTHCVPWSDYATHPLVELTHGIRLDTTYYYWPPGWVNNSPGFFTGSGMPMRFAASDGTLIDVYQAVTQMTDESGQVYPFTIDTLLDRAVGPEGYYGAFVANMHTDTDASSGSDAIVNSALARGIPVISVRQMLAWLDGRNASRFSSTSWNGSTLSFSISVGQGANGLEAMVPIAPGQTVTGITHNGSQVAYSMGIVKGLQYAFFWADNGDYQVTYVLDITPPTVTSVSPANGASGVSTGTNVTATFSEAMDPATINTSTIELRDPLNAVVPATVTYNATTKTATLDPTGPLVTSTTYTTTVKGGTNGVKDVVGNPLTNDFSWSFTTAAVSTGPYSIWNSTTVPGIVDAGPDSPVELGVKFRADSNGQITGIRFYKASTNTGTHVANLWTSTGTLLATATFTNETASGWQQVNFFIPVAITANTVYVASYHTNTGHYSDNQNYFATNGVDSPPLHALANGVSGGNGVYAYGSTSSFPTQTWNTSNYWVDVVFQP